MIIAQENIILLASINQLQSKMASQAISKTTMTVGQSGLTITATEHSTGRVTIIAYPINGNPELRVASVRTCETSVYQGFSERRRNLYIVASGCFQ
ncbi:hypothetical protein PoB_002370300 [Plakobranchus ocellatus]|uniref:Uncharacterized protein n=1 Tax=Plakobranchus ocellatus TaxID=259542 RepID=A0AAV3ZRN0_9GAST|nr:hypothetical protein PoB_002370300 [Plakobranchus ocellatus]